MDNTIEYKVSGKRALFTDPISKIGGEKYSYPVPTYQALKGITESIYWKPTIIWHVDSVRVIKSIRHESQNVRPIKYNGGNDLSIYSYLADVEYQVKAHFEWNRSRDDLVQDRNENKHFSSAVRSVKKGGRRDIFLGTRECQGYVEPCRFGEDCGDYDDVTIDIPFGLMFHSFDYPDETGEDALATRFWSPIMSKGVITFPKNKENTIKRIVREGVKSRKIQTKMGEESG
jgi:CRISPR-associated protein Cas5d